VKKAHSKHENTSTTTRVGRTFCKHEQLQRSVKSYNVTKIASTVHMSKLEVCVIDEYHCASIRNKPIESKCRHEIRCDCSHYRQCNCV